MRKIRKICLTDTLDTLEVGEEMTISMRDYGPTSVRGTAWALSKRSGKKFSIRQSSKDLTSYITRIL